MPSLFSRGSLVLFMYSKLGSHVVSELRKAKKCIFGIIRFFRGLETLFSQKNIMGIYSSRQRSYVPIFVKKKSISCQKCRQKKKKERTFPNFLRLFGGQNPILTDREKDVINFFNAIFIINPDWISYSARQDKLH